MKTMRSTFLTCSLLSLQPVLFAASIPGYVIEWGMDTAAGAVAPAKLVHSNAVAISAGTFHSLALRPDGTVYGWGGDLVGAVLGSKLPEPVVTNGIVRIGGHVLSNVITILAARELSV